MAAPRVLVVDDEPDVAGLLAHELSAAGYAVTTVHDGAAALAHLRRDGADLVLLDIVMPGVDGWQVLAELHAAGGALADVPVVMVTALSAETDVIRGQLSGAVRYVTKPFRIDHLLATLEDVLRPESETARARRRSEVAGLLQRLAELETGRRRSDAHVRLSRLERLTPPVPATTVDPVRLERLTPREREVAALFASGVGARRIAAHLGSSRANVYATRKRIGRKLGVPTDAVAETARALGLAGEAPADGSAVVPDVSAAG